MPIPRLVNQKQPTNQKSSYTASKFWDGRLPGHQGQELPAQPIRERLLAKSSPRQQRGQARLLGNRVTPRGSTLSATPNALRSPLSGGRAPWATQETNQHTSL
ncbi:hypothetical protein IscW_ISCW017762 [Ixodes scapularis]|uniref:Uncharacterized protein n=1 Tax=Ixodes scapularis TaxID=6945 RepID=B7PGA4_IXOSC|nr:hypothetical protein IscW_ISCW017762 [Ixodes scapularis]|eukprot:XP_002434226.1 hypothetical protein IscW_ISCW017762 [Ixodes scapularis]